MAHKQENFYQNYKGKCEKMITIGRNLIKSIELKYHLTCWIGCSLLCPVARNLPVTGCADAAVETAAHTEVDLCVCWPFQSGRGW